MIAGTPFVLSDFELELKQLGERLSRACLPLGTIRRVAQRIADGTAVCLACTDGMVVLTLEQGPGDTIEALVLLAVSTGRHGGFKACEPHMLAIARDLGASRLSFCTERAGWARLLGPEWTREGDFYWRNV